MLVFRDIRHAFSLEEPYFLSLIMYNDGIIFKFGLKSKVILMPRRVV